ncbi:MAG: hypothetical protein U1E45_23715 [Geminicoccaceae bacterium]
MIELLLIVCLQSQPDKCEEIYLTPGQPVSIMQCMFNGAKQAALWAKDHPGYVVKRWNCGEPRA